MSDVVFVVTARDGADSDVVAVVFVVTAGDGAMSDVVFVVFVVTAQDGAMSDVVFVVTAGDGEALMLFLLLQFEMELCLMLLLLFLLLQLEMERALLEGEHQTEMEKLDVDQERIDLLKQRQVALEEQAAHERERVRCHTVVIETKVKVDLLDYPTSKPTGEG